MQTDAIKTLSRCFAGGTQFYTHISHRSKTEKHGNFVILRYNESHAQACTFMSTSRHCENLSGVIRYTVLSQN